MSVTSRLRQHLKSNPEVAKFLMPSTKNEVLLDLNEDGKIDFAFIDTTGNGQPETFALDFTGNGELNLYCYDADGNGFADTILYYPDGQDMPIYTRISKSHETKIETVLGELRGVIKGNDAQEIKDCLNRISDHFHGCAKNYGKTGTLARMRSSLKADPEMAALLCYSPKNELYFDLNEDGIADFALVDTNHDGEIDTFAMDLTGDGEFDLYISDKDNNGVADRALYYKPGEEEPAAGAEGEKVEEALRPSAMKFLISLRSEFSAKNLIKSMKAYRKEAVAALKKLED